VAVLTLHVTPGDLQFGKAKSPCDCPLSRAFKRLPLDWEVAIYRAVSRDGFEFDHCGSRVVVRLPRSLLALMQSIDGWLGWPGEPYVGTPPPPEPGEFSLEVPDYCLRLDSM
jgi:hypothetical protein